MFVQTATRIMRVVFLLLVALLCSGTSLLTQEALTKSLRAELPVEEPLQIFAHIFSQLPDEIDVLPSENYYYFRFASYGSWYWGNMRLSPGLRDEGKMHFAYARQHEPETQVYRLLGSEDGVTISKETNHVYRVGYAGKSVRFKLNQVPQHPPVDYRLRPWEKFIARSEDESGMRFLLFYNASFKHFYWALDNEQPMDIRLRPISEALLLQPESAFVFFRDGHDDRYLLAAVNRDNITANNYYDGPFDQLADNILDRTPFADYLQEAYIETRGKITRRAELDNGMRVAIIPYMPYSKTDDIEDYLQHCRKRYKETSGFYFCFFRDQTRVYLDDLSATAADALTGSSGMTSGE